MEKTSPNIMSIDSIANQDLVTGANQQCIPETIRFFSISLPSGKVGDSACNLKNIMNLLLLKTGMGAKRWDVQYGLVEKENKMPRSI
jgi:hypothetical protein